MKRAFITGVTGQDGHYLSELLLSKGYRVWGLVRRSSQPRSIPPGIEVVEGDITDAHSITRAIRLACPDEIYNLAAQSHVGRSFNEPDHTFRVNTLGTINVLEASNDARIYQASTSEMFGDCWGLLNEQSPMRPVSPYGISKMAAHSMAVAQRNRGWFVSCGILFNHESPLRGADFVTQKIARGIAAIEAGKQKKIVLGNLDASRDWGHAKDYVRAMWMMLQQGTPGDYVIATGEARTVRRLLRFLLGDKYMNMVSVDPDLLRPNEVSYLAGDSSKAEKELGWKPEITFESMMMELLTAARSHP